VQQSFGVLPISDRQDDEVVLVVNAAEQQPDEGRVQCGFRRFAQWQCEACGASQHHTSFLTSNPTETAIDAGQLQGSRKDAGRWLGYRAVLEADPDGVWRRIVQSAIELKARYPRLTWEQVAANVEVNHEQLRKWQRRVQHMKDADQGYTGAEFSHHFFSATGLIV
jgi:hypothetical protein